MPNDIYALADKLCVETIWSRDQVLERIRIIEPLADIAEPEIFEGLAEICLNLCQGPAVVEAAMRALGFMPDPYDIGVSIADGMITTWRDTASG